MAETDGSSYIDYETFLDPAFSPTRFANSLVLATNDASDTSLDLNTPLSRALFDVQEVDTLIDGLTNKSALPLLQYTQDNVEAGARILQALEGQISSLTEGYQRLHREVIDRYDAAEETRLVTDRLWQTVRLGQAVGRCLALGRQLEAQYNEFRRQPFSTKREDHRVMVRGANTVLSLRQLLNPAAPGAEVDILDRLALIRALRSDLVDPAEKAFVSKAEQVIGQFSMSALSSSGPEAAVHNGANPVTFAQSEDTRSRTNAAVLTLYLLSPIAQPLTHGTFEPGMLVSAIQDYLRRALTSSLAGLSTALATLPRLERTLLEVSARCQNIVALEMLLRSTKPPPHPMLSAKVASDALEHGPGSIQGAQRAPSDLLEPILASLDTSSLPSYFWRSMASQLSARVQKILKDGGVSARTLRSNKDRVRDSMRECVYKGSRLPASSLGQGKATVIGNWEREAAVMTGAVTSVLGR